MDAKPYVMPQPVSGEGVDATVSLGVGENPSKRLVYQAIGEKPVRRDTFSLTQDEINGLVNHLLKDLKAK